MPFFIVQMYREIMLTGYFFKYDTSFCIKINRYKTTNWLVLLSVLHGSLHCISSAVWMVSGGWGVIKRLSPAGTLTPGQLLPTLHVTCVWTSRNVIPLQSKYRACIQPESCGRATAWSQLNPYKLIASLIAGTNRPHIARGPDHR